MEDSEAVLKPLSHDLREVVRSIRFRIDHICQEVSESSVLYKDLKVADGLAKEFGKAISTYREKTNKKLSRGKPETFAEVVSKIEDDFSPTLDEIEILVNRYASLPPGQRHGQSSSILLLSKHIERLRRRLDSLRDYADTRGELSISRFGFQNEVSRIIVDLNALVKESNAEITRIGSRSYISADQIKVALLVQNIIQNSIRYAKKDSNPKIQISTKFGQYEKYEYSDEYPLPTPESYFFFFSVSDNGLGIPEDDAPFVFDPAYRVAHSDVEEAGTGMGLSIVKQVVDRHSGVVWLDTEPKVGTTVNVALPQEKNPGVF